MYIDIAQLHSKKSASWAFVFYYKFEVYGDRILFAVFKVRVNR